MVPKYEGEPWRLINPFCTKVQRQEELVPSSKTLHYKKKIVVQAKKHVLAYNYYVKNITKKDLSKLKFSSSSVF